MRHVVLISMIGADRVPIGYLRTQLRAEEALMESAAPPSRSWPRTT
ncbi:hypothetical protein ABZ914_03320 [Spirillospora sp. NPDC046719]